MRNPAQRSIDFSLEGAESKTVDQWANNPRRGAAQCRRGAQCVTDAGAQGPAVYIDIDRDTASRLSISAATVDDALYSAFGQRIVSTIFTDTNQYRVILEGRPGFAQQSEQSWLIKPARYGWGTHPTVPPSPQLRAQRASADYGTLPSIRRRRSASIPRHMSPSDPPLRPFVPPPRRSVCPPSITLSFVGASGAYQNSLANELWLILAALVCVYIVLGVLYESYIHPLTILSTCPPRV